MQIDQATQLRRLVSRVQERECRPARSPRLIVVASGKGGVGATSIAVNLAVALATGRRVALVDCDLDNADATALCGLYSPLTLVDVLQGAVRANEALQPGPQGVSVLAGLWGANQVLHCTSAQAHRLIVELQQMDSFDDILLDIGCGSTELASELWRSADQLLAVLTPDTTALMNTYAGIKRFAGDAPRPLQVVVNHASGPQTAAEISQRLADSARRFLSLEVELLGWLPFDPDLDAAGCHRTSVFAHAPHCAAAQALRLMAGVLKSASPARSESEVAAVPTAWPVPHDGPACCES